METNPNQNEMIPRTRAEVDLRHEPKTSSNIVDRIGGDCPVEVLSGENGWYKVRPSRMLHTVAGYVPDAALVFPTGNRQPVFPLLLTEPGLKTIPSVPATLYLSEFSAWLASGGKPGWINQNLWDGMSGPQQADLAKKIWAASVGQHPYWEEWLAQVKENDRLNQARMLEWIVLREGGKELFAIRDHYVYSHPDQGFIALGSVVKGQILRWTGAVSYWEKDGKKKEFYEVDFYRLNRYFHGWFRGDVLGEYVFPSPDVDTSLESNAKTVFDLSRSVLRLPQDAEIIDAKKRYQKVSQYIDVFGATEKHLVHFSLCGEFCVAALCGSDIIPILKKWMDSKYWRTKEILANPNEGTSVSDLQSILKLNFFRGETYSSLPTTPRYIKDRIDSGQFAIIGCGINSAGIVKANGKIRHWVVLVDFIPSGSGGWARVYNPFNNREEVYDYNMLLKSMNLGIGLWVSPTN